MRRVALASALLLAVVASTRVSAQVCLGVPTSSGQLALTGMIGLPHGGFTYGAGANFDLRGPFSLVTHLSVTTPNAVEYDIKTFAAAVAYEISAAALSICPMLGFEASTYGVRLTGVNLTWRETVLPVSIGIGRNIPLGSVSLTVYGMPQYLYSRVSFNLDQRGVVTSRTVIHHEQAMTAGVRFRRHNVFGGGSVGFTSFNEWKFPAYTFTAGLLIGEMR